MRINIGIVSESLSDLFDMEISKKGQRSLNLRRLEFYAPLEALKEDSLYLASSDKLQEYQAEFNGMSFICVGEMPRWAPVHDDCTLLLVRGKQSIIEVFRAAQQVFYRYEAWEEALVAILRSSASLLEMVELSVPIFGNPLQINDYQYNMLARTSITQSEGGALQSFSVESIKSKHTLDNLKVLKDDHLKDNEKRVPYLWKDGRLCINLFVYDRFVGNMQLIPLVRLLRAGDFELFNHFAQLVMEALKSYTKVSSSHIHTRKSILKSILEQKSVDQSWLNQLAQSKEGKPNDYVCFRLQLYSDSYALPLETVCITLESILPGCVAFEHESVIVAFLSMADSSYSFDDCLVILESLLENIDFVAGISNYFEDVQSVRQYYGQASCAIETGTEIHPGRRYYLFSEYALFYMLFKSKGALESEFVCPRGLVRLRERDKATNGDYWKTLKVYLDNKMNATQAAKQLYLHRSTMMQKLNRITSILDVDLHDTDVRLYVQLCMKLMDTET